MRARAFLERLFQAAVASVQPEAALGDALPDPPPGRTVVVGAGKGAAQLARAVERRWPGPLSGVVVTRYGHGVPCRRIRVLEAAHPVPDAAGERASKEILRAVSGLGPDDLVLALITGGGSALLAAPPEGLTLADEQALARGLLASGAPIGVMNAIRREVSRIRGGRLARAAAPARVVSLIVSDVPGDDPAEVASGPTISPPIRRENVRRVVAAHGLVLPEQVAAFLAGEDDPAPAPDDPAFARGDVRVIASARVALEAAAAAAGAEGIPAVILSDAIEGEAREAGRVLAAIATEVARRARPFTPPVVLLSGGETTVSLRGPAGQGGRNSELLLAFAQAIEGVDGIVALAADTDGIDGTAPEAGAFADGASAGRMRAAGRDPAAALAGHESRAAFAAAGGLFAPGPTGTNVNDFRAILIAPGSAL